MRRRGATWVKWNSKLISFDIPFHFRGGKHIYHSQYIKRNVSFKLKKPLALHSPSTKFNRSKLPNLDPSWRNHHSPSKWFICHLRFNTKKVNFQACYSNLHSLWILMSCLANFCFCQYAMRERSHHNFGVWTRLCCLQYSGMGLTIVG